MTSTQPVSIWGRFPDTATAGQALSRLERSGFLQSQIAVQKRFQDALAGFDWAQAMYVRLPEGLVIGFVSGIILSVLLSLAAAKGWPHPLLLSVMALACSVAGAVLGAFLAVMYARFDSWRNAETLAANANDDDTIAIGVHCYDSKSQVEVKHVFAESGAASVNIEA